VWLTLLGELQGRPEEGEEHVQLGLVYTPPEDIIKLVIGELHLCKKLGWRGDHFLKITVLSDKGHCPNVVHRPKGTETLQQQFSNFEIISKYGTALSGT
jgi:hypothetical protein